MLIATGIMAIGLVLVSLIFPVAVKLTTMSTERSIATVVADEAFAKIRLYGLRDFPDWPSAILNPISGNPDPNAPYDFCDGFLFITNGNLDPGSDGDWGTADDEFLWLGDDQAVGGTGDDLDFLDDDQIFLNESLYPSDVTETDRKYSWSALCRRAGDKDVQVTVFVSRKTFPGIRYYGFFHDRTADPDNPKPVYDDTSIRSVPVRANVRYNVNGVGSPPLRELVLDLSGTDNIAWNGLKAGTVYSFFGEGYTIVNDRDGRIYRIMEMEDRDVPKDGIRETIILFEDWRWDGYDADPLNPPIVAQPEAVWVVPPGLGSSRYPCVSVFQKVIRFDEID